MNLIDFLNSTPIRVRVAFVLAIAEYALELFPHFEGRLLVREALDAAWKWERGFDIPANVLHDYIEGGGSGLLAKADFAIARNAPEEPVFQVASIAVGYTCREAYLRVQTWLPEAIEQATEEAVEQAINVYMSRIHGYDVRIIDRISTVLLTQYRTEHPDELGPILDRDSVLSLGYGQK